MWYERFLSYHWPLSKSYFINLGANSESIDLLPSPTSGADWIRDLPTDEGRESDQIYEFDGASNSVLVPEEVFDHNLTSQFTISFWMKHEPPLDQSNKHIKEHIICNADDHSMMMIIIYLGTI